MSAFPARFCTAAQSVLHGFFQLQAQIITQEISEGKSVF
jgi:hypothetical protein